MRRLLETFDGQSCVPMLDYLFRSNFIDLANPPTRRYFTL